MCNMLCPINSETGYIWAKLTHYLAPHMWKAVGNETVLYGPVVLTGFFLLLLYPPHPLFISSSFRLWRGRHVARRGGGRMDLQPGVRASPWGSRRQTQDLTGRWPAVSVIYGGWGTLATADSSPLSPPLPFTHTAGPQGATHTAPPSTGAFKKGFLAHAKLHHKRAYIHCIQK